MPGNRPGEAKAVGGGRAATSFRAFGDPFKGNSLWGCLTGFPTVFKALKVYAGLQSLCIRFGAYGFPGLIFKGS